MPDAVYTAGTTSVYDQWNLQMISGFLFSELLKSLVENISVHQLASLMANQTDERGEHHRPNSPCVAQLI